MNTIRRGLLGRLNFLHFLLKGCISLYFFLILPSTYVKAQGKLTNEYQLKAAFIFNFTRFISWPPNTFSTSDSPFVIGILGDDRFSASVEEIVKGEKLENRAFFVQRFNNSHEITSCNILFISAQDVLSIKDRLPDINRRGVLTVSDAPNFAKSGGIISFFTRNNKLRLQINIDEAKASKLNISSKLLSVSNIYSPN